jgi:hypothetical protein
MKFRMNLNLVLSALNIACAIDSIFKHTYGLATFNGVVGIWCLLLWWNCRKEWLHAQEPSSN